MSIEPKKLKRGLRDISPLFAEPQNVYPSKVIKETILKETLAEKPALQLVSVFHPRYQKNSQVLDFWMARHVMTFGHQAAVLSISAESRSEAGKQRPVYQEDVPYKAVRLSDFEKICATSVKSGELAQSSLLFLNFSWLQAAYFRRVIPVLDKMVLWISSDLEMLTETYRQLKWLVKLNSKTEFCIAYDGSSGNHSGSVVFEKFSEMVSRNLKVGLNWLGGCEALSQAGDMDAFDWEGLLQKRGGSLTLNEKRGLADYLMAAS